MTFSEFIKTYALQAYYDYCKRNKLEPKIDLIPPPQTKLAALLTKKPNA